MAKRVKPISALPGAAAPIDERTSATAVSQRVRQSRSQAPLRQQAERLAGEQAAVETMSVDPAADALPRQARRQLERRRAKLVARELRLLRHDEEVVREVLSRKGPLDSVTSAATTAPCDELIWYATEHLKLLPALTTLAPPCKVTRRDGEVVDARTDLQPITLNLCSLIARWLDCPSGADVQNSVLRDKRWMTLLGFNITEVCEGASQRSTSLRGMTRDDQHRFVPADEAGPVRERPDDPVRGALSVQTLAGHEARLSSKALREFFDATVQSLVSTVRLRGKRVGIVDTTLIEVPPSFKGGGTTRRKVRVKSKARRPKAREVQIYGFKVWSLMDAATSMVLAYVFDTADRPDNLHVRALVAQAQRNLGDSAHLQSLVLDRGFLDGDLLFGLTTEAGLDWVVPAKESMRVTEEARQRVAQALSSAARPGESELETAQRLARSRVQGGDVCFETRRSESGRADLVVAQVNDLYETVFYGPGGADSSRQHSKHFEPTPLHATVVLAWPDRTSSTPKDEEEEGFKGFVLLSPHKEKGLARYDRYDQRSLIENRQYRDGKQYFALGTSYSRTASGMEASVVFSTVALLLHRGLRAHEEALQARQDEDLDRRAPQLGVLRYRRLHELRHRDQVVIVTQGCYAIMELVELLGYAGFDMI